VHVGPRKQEVRTPRTRRSAEAILPGRVREPNRALIEKWLDGVGMNLAAASRELNADNRNVLTRILGGSRECRIAEAITLARLARVPLADLVDALGYGSSRSPTLADDALTGTAEVVGVLGGDGIVVPHAEPGRTMRRPPGMGPTARAISVADTPLVPSTHRNSVLYYHQPTSGGIQLGALDRLCVVGDAGAQQTYCGFLRAGRTETTGALVTLGGAVAAQISEVAYATPVLWMRCGASQNTG
jgi:hypothetical protein